MQLDTELWRNLLVHAACLEDMDRVAAEEEEEEAYSVDGGLTMVLVDFGLRLQMRLLSWLLLWLLLRLWIQMDHSLLFFQFSSHTFALSDILEFQ